MQQHPTALLRASRLRRQGQAHRARTKRHPARRANVTDEANTLRQRTCAAEGHVHYGSATLEARHSGSPPFSLDYPVCERCGARLGPTWALTHTHHQVTGVESLELTADGMSVARSTARRGWHTIEAVMVIDDTGEGVRRASVSFGGIGLTAAVLWDETGGCLPYADKSQGGHP